MGGGEEIGLKEVVRWGMNNPKIFLGIKLKLIVTRVHKKF